MNTQRVSIQSGTMSEGGGCNIVSRSTSTQDTAGLDAIASMQNVSYGNGHFVRSVSSPDVVLSSDVFTERDGSRNLTKPAVETGKSCCKETDSKVVSRLAAEFETASFDPSLPLSKPNPVEAQQTRKRPNCLFVNHLGTRAYQNSTSKNSKTFASLEAALELTDLDTDFKDDSLAQEIEPINIQEDVLASPSDNNRPSPRSVRLHTDFPSSPTMSKMSSNVSSPSPPNDIPTDAPQDLLHEDFIGMPSDYYPLDVPTDNAGALVMEPHDVYFDDMMPTDLPNYYPSESPTRMSQVIDVGMPTDLGFQLPCHDDPEGMGLGLMVPKLQQPQRKANAAVRSKKIQTSSSRRIKKPRYMPYEPYEPYPAMSPGGGSYPTPSSHRRVSYPGESPFVGGTVPAYPGNMMKASKKRPQVPRYITMHPSSSPSTWNKRGRESPQRLGPPYIRRGPGGLTPMPYSHPPPPPPPTPTRKTKTVSMHPPYPRSMIPQSKPYHP